jgi:hypothetical protein
MDLNELARLIGRTPSYLQRMADHPEQKRNTVPAGRDSWHQQSFHEGRGAPMA